MELKDTKCSVCGAPFEKHAHLEVTGCGKVMCPDCERACPNYRTYTLPNGTHCMAAFEAEFFNYRLLAMNIPAPPAAVEATRHEYQGFKTGNLFEQLADLARRYHDIKTPAAAANARVELEAMRQELYERMQGSEINRHLFETFETLVKMRKEYAKG